MGVTVGVKFTIGKMNNLATKPSSFCDSLVAVLFILTSMRHEPDMSAARSITIVCPRTRDLIVSQLMRYLPMEIPLPMIRNMSVASSALNVSITDQLTSQT